MQKARLMAKRKGRQLMKGFLNALRWEAVLDIKEYSRYRTGLWMDFLIFTGAFVMIYLMGTGSGFLNFYGTTEKGGNILLFIGYVFWQNGAAALGYCCSSIRSETSQGIFEARLQSRYPVTLMLFLRLLMSILVHLATYAGLIAFAALAARAGSRDIAYILLAILVSFPSLIGMYGMGLLLGAVSIHEKQTGNLLLILQTALLFMTNTLSANRVKVILLIPFTSGIEIVRNLYLGMAVPLSLWAVYLTVNLLWAAMGSAVFSKALKNERRYGIFDTY